MSFSSESPSRSFASREDDNDGTTRRISGGLTVRGHIHGKDSIYAASLFVEMISAVERSPSEIMDALEERYGHFEMVEDNITFTEEQKELVKDMIFDKKPKAARDYKKKKRRPSSYASWFTTNHHTL